MPLVGSWCGHDLSKEAPDSVVIVGEPELLGMIPERAVRQSQKFGGAFLLTAALLQRLAHQVGPDGAQMFFEIDALLGETHVVEAAGVLACLADDRAGFPTR